jgi:hypothetical protein
MVPTFDEFKENVMFMGGEDGGNSAVMVHARQDAEGSRALGSSGLRVGGISTAKALIASGCAPALDFKIFFGHVRWAPSDLKGILSDGGWRTVVLPAAQLAEATLANGDTGLWEALRTRIDRKDQAVPPRVTPPP